MTFRQRNKYLLGAVFALLALSGGPALADVGVGPFTAAQVKAGHDIFMSICAGCHGPRLKGRNGGATLTRTRWMDSWGRETTKDLYRFISTRMPYNNPGSLSAEDYTNIVPFLLAANGAKPGPTPFNKDIAVKIGSITDGWTVEEVLRPLPSWTNDFEGPCVSVAIICEPAK